MVQSAAQKTDASATVALQAILLGTAVLTLDGEMPVEFLQPGDRVLTRAGMRRIVQIEVTVVHNARAVMISHDTLGVDRPSADLTVSAGQHILIRDWRAKILTGAAQAMVPAGRLVDGEYIRAAVLPEARFFTLGFAEDAVIYAGGLELAFPALAPAL